MRNNSDLAILEARAEILNLKRENKELKEALDLAIEDRDSYHEENDELKKGVTLSLRKSQVMQRMLQVERQCYTIEEDNKYLRRRLVEVNNRDTELREQVFELTKDQIRMDWLLSKAYFIQLTRGAMLTSRQAIDKEIEKEMKSPSD